MHSDKFRLAIVGIGNTLAGDDAAGIWVLHLLQEKFRQDDRLLFICLEGDLYEISDYLDRAEQFIFLDAIAGANAGDIVFGSDVPRAFAPSFHQTDIGAVMKCLQLLDYAEPFPVWNVCGITVHPPREISYELSPAVEKSVPLLVDNLTRIIEQTLL